MNLFEEVARDAGKALGECGAGEGSALVLEVAERLAELASEAPVRRRRFLRRRGPPPSKRSGREER